MTCRWQVELDPQCRQVLAKHWPDVKRYEDVRNVGSHNLEPVDLICGGFPCQPVSLAGKRRGEADDRWLWPEMFRVVTELRPSWCCFENTPGLISMGLDGCLSDLEAAVYTAWAVVLPACAVGAPHRRDRVWVVAHTESERRAARWPQLAGWAGDAASLSLCQPPPANPERLALDANQFHSTATNSDVAGPLRRQTQSGVRGRHDGFSNEMDGGGLNDARALPERVGSEKRPKRLALSRMDRLRMLGNAVVPQLVEVIGRAILASKGQT